MEGKVANFSEFIKNKELEEEKREIIDKSQKFLKTFGLEKFCLDFGVGLSLGFNTPDDLSAWYLNSMLEKRLGRGCIINGGSPGFILNKFEGLKLFKNLGNGPLRWAVKKINQNAYRNLEEVYVELNKNDFPGGGHFLVLWEKNTNRDFLLDPNQKVFDFQGYIIGDCWLNSNGEEYFFVKESELKYIFIPNKGQSPEKIIAEAEREWHKRKFFKVS